MRVKVKAKEQINPKPDPRLCHWSPRMESLCGQEIEVKQCSHEPDFYYGAEFTWHHTWLELDD